ncbi:MAG: flagellar basal-body rod protein FlgF [Desulfobacterales bacterium]
MSDAIYMATSGALCNQQRLEILSNNLANVNTTGFKEEMAYIRVTEVPPDVLEGLQNTVPGTGEPTAPLWQELESRTVFSQGGLRTTGSPLDMAIDGEAFFCIQTPDGVAYTRNGSFTRSAQGELTTHDGLAVLGESGPIQIDDGRRVTIDETGNVSVDGTQVAKLRLVELDQPLLLQRRGGSLFAAREGAAIQETPSESARVIQGHLELSNVEAVRTMTEMIDVLRGFEAYQKAIRQIDETEAKAINEVGRLA